MGPSMIQIGEKIVSRELFDQHFICHLAKCEGNCCVFGDSGAPLEEVESRLLEEELEQFICTLRPEGQRAVREQGAWVFDQDGDRVTPLVGGEECAYVRFRGNIAYCAIEEAYEKGLISFQKPESCHLYPIRISKLKKGLALNYHRWSICEPARILGEKEEQPVFRFLKDAITRVFGKEFYQEMEMVYKELAQQTLNKED